MQTRVKSSLEIESMRESGRILATVLATLKAAVEPGMNTKDLAEIAKREIRSTGGLPTFLGYYGFPDVLCVSINDEVVHGIPSSKHFIKNGDVVSLDFGVTYKGMITDSAISFIAGKANSKITDLVFATEQSLMAGISNVRGGANVGDISYAIQAVLDKNKYGIVRDLVGHGVGHELHEEPNIPNYGKKGTGQKLLSGMTIAIEPMATLGGYDVKTDSDNWTIRTTDGSVSAHFEHTILITDEGAEILTTL